VEGGRPFGERGGGIFNEKTAVSSFAAGEGEGKGVEEQNVIYGKWRRKGTSGDEERGSSSRRA